MAGRISLGELRKPVEVLIDVYSKARTEPTFDVAWQALVVFWIQAGDAPMVTDDDGDEVPDYESAHFDLAYRFVASMDHVGFSAEGKDGEDYLRTAAADVVGYLNEAEDERDILSAGKASELEDGTFLTVNLLDARVILGKVPFKTMPIRRTERKIGRNEPCECGSGRKYKKCCLSKAQAAK